MKMFNIIAILFFLISISFAQQLSELHIVGSPQQEPNQIVTKDTRDKNGEVCAGLIVQSDLKGLTYNANNGIVKLKPNPGEDFIFLSPDEQVVKIYCGGYTPLEIILNDVGIKLESGKTWSLKITGDQKLMQADKDLFEIVFTFNAEDVYAGYNNLALNIVKEKTTTFKLPKGDYIFRFSKEGYNELTQRISVTKNISQPIVLQQSGNKKRPFTVSSATVIINSDPQDGEILLNGQQLGVTPYSDAVTAGEYRLEIRKPFYQTDISSFTVKAGEQKQIDRTLTPKFGYLSVTSSQQNSSVVLDGKPFGFAPIDKRQIESGHHSIKISALHYHDYTEEFDVKDGETKTVSANLKPAFGTLEISTQPENGASVFLDDELKGTTPLTLNQVVSGKYIVKVSKEFYNSREEQAIISDGQITRKTIKLSPNFGELTVNANSSTIYIDGKRVGENKYFTRLSPGKHTLKAARSEQYSTDEKEIFLALGEKKSVDLEPTGRFGEVVVIVNPSEAAKAEIFIDDEKKGNAPIPLALLIGNYTLSAKKNGFLDFSQPLVVSENDKKKITIEMLTYEGTIQAKRDTWGMYKWISAAAAVGAGAAVYYFNSKADSYYNEYQTATISDVAASKRNSATENVTKYRISSGAAITFSFSFLVTWYVQSSY